MAKHSAGVPLVYGLGIFARILTSSLLFFKQRRISSQPLVMQIYFTFAQAMGITAMLALGIGAAVSSIGFPFLRMVSQEQLLYPLLVAVVTRELGPLLTALIVIARSATAIATETAGMVIDHEIEAYLSVGVDPIEHLAVPRFIAMIVSLLLLNFYFSVFGLVGSFVIVQAFHTLPAGVYFGSLLQSFSVPDIVTATVKALAFGMIISTIAITEGLGVERASTEVPVAALRAVSRAFVVCIAVNILVSALYYMVFA